MTRRCLLLSVITLCAAASPALAQSQPSPEAMQKLLEGMRPTAEHKDLAALVGRWTQEITYSMGGPPMKTTGTATNRLILGGRFLVSEGSSPNPAGPGFGDPTLDFMSIYGFDRRTRDFTIVGFDSLGTYYVTGAGKKTDAGTIVMPGETLDDHAGVTDMRKYDMVLKIIDPDTYLSEIIFKFPGRPNQTVVSITHRRIK